MTRVKTQSPTWRVKARALARELESAHATLAHATLLLEAVKRDREALRAELAVALASPAGSQADATPLDRTAIADELTAEAQKLGLYEEQP